MHLNDYYLIFCSCDWTNSGGKFTSNDDINRGYEKRNR